MLKFANLSLARKRFVVSVIEKDSAYKKNPNITLKECTAIYRQLKSERIGAKNEKIGYPNWLFANNKVERGVYQLPLPTATELSDYQQELNAKLSPVKKSKTSVKKSKVVTAKVVADKKVSAKTVGATAKKSADADVEEFNAILRENGIETIA